MSNRIEVPNSAGWRDRFKLIVQIIRGLNPLMNIRLNYSVSAATASINYSTESVMVTIPDPQPKIDILQSQIDSLQSQVNSLQAQVDAEHP